MTHVLTYAKPKSYPVPWKLTLAISSFLLAFVNLQLTTCMCGHQLKEGIPGNLLATTVSFIAFAIPSTGLVGRAVAALCTILTTVCCARNLYGVSLGLG